MTTFTNNTNSRINIRFACSAVLVACTMLAVTSGAGADIIMPTGVTATANAWANNDAIYAIDNVCSHDEGPLGDGTLHGDRVECPRHGALFDVRSGAAKTLPAVRGVRSYPARIVDGQVEVDIHVDPEG